MSNIESELNCMTTCLEALTAQSMEAEHRVLEFLISQHNQRVREHLDRAGELGRLKRLTDLEKGTKP